ncbi:MAG: tripartite tricarboxylate transporter substrate binding protein [Pseudomonadota bacterium]|nr:tripartite tricarboxylate transporter substrate binding protein [Pseudomonadota bacterium]
MLKHVIGAALALGMTAGAALADWAPSGPIKLWIGFGAGGETDTLGRLIGKEMSDATGWTVVVENKPGGGGIAMFTQLATVPADGQTIGMGVSMPVLVNLTVRADQVPFTLDSFDYLASVASAQLAIVARKDAPFDDLAGLLAHAASSDGALVGFDAKPQELLLNVLNKEGGALRPVSMKSSAELVQNLLGGHLDAAFNAGTHIPYLDSGELKMIASANAGRHSYAPDTPTVREQGYDIYVDPVFYIAAPAGLGDDVKSVLSDALLAAMNADSVRDAIQNALHTEPSGDGPEATRAMMDDGMKNVATLFGK